MVSHRVLHNRGVRALIAPLLTLYTSACATFGLGAQQEPKECHVHVRVHAGSTVNPDRSGQPLPTVVRVLELGSVSRLSNSAFDKVWEEAEGTLADDLLRSVEVTVYPGEEKAVAFTLHDETRHLAAVALFRDPVGRDWVSVVDAKDPSGVGLCAASGQAALVFALRGTQIRVAERSRGVDAAQEDN